MLTPSAASPARTPRSARSQRGLSLVEVAVAAAVLLCVVAGSMSLMIAVKRRSADAEFQVAAAALSLEIVERMRLNRAAALAGEYDTTRAAQQAAPVVPGVVQADLQAWRSELTRQLPAGAGRISTQSASGVVSVSVTVQWQRPTEAGASSTAQETFSFRL